METIIVGDEDNTEYASLLAIKDGVPMKPLNMPWQYIRFFNITNTYNTMVHLDSRIFEL